MTFTRKHNISQHTGDPKTSKKGKDAEEPIDPQVDCPIVGGMFDPTFNLGHKIDFNFDEAERKVIESTSEQIILKKCRELARCTVAAAWTLAYASNRGNLRIELEQAKAQLNEVTIAHSLCEKKQKDAEKVIAEGRAIMENL